MTKQVGAGGDGEVRKEVANDGNGKKGGKHTRRGLSTFFEKEETQKKIRGLLASELADIRDTIEKLRADVRRLEHRRDSDDGSSTGAPKEGPSRALSDFRRGRDKRTVAKPKGEENPKIPESDQKQWRTNP